MSGSTPDGLGVGSSQMKGETSAPALGELNLDFRAPTVRSTTSYGTSVQSGDGWLHAFVDESGTFDLSVGSRYFIAAAVLVPEASLATAIETMDAIAEKLGSGAEVKSHRIKSRHELRMKYLRAIQEIDFSYAFLIVDKEAIGDTSGLRFKRSFQKFFKNLLQRPLAHYSGPGIRVCFDKYGSPEFMGSFEKYMREEVSRTLWFDHEVSHVDSKDNRLVQLADLIAGSLAHCYEPSRRSDYSPLFRELLAEKEFSATSWPPPDRPPHDATAHELDGVLWSTGVVRAEATIKQLGTGADPSERASAACLEYLLMRRTMEEGARQSIHGERLAQLLQDDGYPLASLQTVRDTMASLRDRGLVVAGTASGYKLALTVQDIDEYLTFTEGHVSPMLHRVRTARESVHLATEGKLDILDDSWSNLRVMVESVGELALPATGVDPLIDL